MGRPLLALLVIGQASLLAQQPAPPTFRTATHLIVQTVSVKDKAGKPIAGLTAKDFVVTEDGQPQEIAFVEYQPLDAAPASSLSAETPPTEAIAATTVPPVTQAGIAVPLPGDVRYRGRRLLVLYIDLSNMPFFDQFRVYASAEKYITAQMTPVDMMAIIVFQNGRLSLKQDFTDDRAALREVVRGLMTAADESERGIGANWD